MDEIYIGFSTNTNIYGEYKDGKWKVEMVFTQNRTKDLENWERKEVSVSAMDETLDRAVAHVHLTMVAYLEKVGGDLFIVEENESGKSTGTLLQ